MEKNQRGEVSEATRRAEDEEARSAHEADHPATPDEEASLDDEAVDPEVREHYREMTALGANEKGEGRIP